MTSGVMTADWAKRRCAKGVTTADAGTGLGWKGHLDKGWHA